MGDLDDVAAMTDGRAGCEYAFHAAASLGDWGRREDFVRGNVTGTRERAAGLPRGRRAALRARGHRGGAARRPAARERGRARAAAARLEGALPRDEGDGRAGGAATRTRDGFETVVLRPRLVWGPGDTTIVPALKEAVEQGPLLLDRRRRPPDLDDPRGQRRRGPRPGRDAQGEPGDAYFVTDGDPVVFRDFITELLATDGVEHARPERPGRRSRSRSPAIGEGIWSALRRDLRPPRSPASPYWLSAHGVHDRHLEGAQRARLRAGQDDRGGHGGAAGGVRFSARTSWTGSTGLGWENYDRTHTARVSRADRHPDDGRGEGRPAPRESRAAAAGRGLLLPDAVVPAPGREGAHRRRRVRGRVRGRDARRPVHARRPAPADHDRRRRERGARAEAVRAGPPPLQRREEPELPGRARAAARSKTTPRRAEAALAALRLGQLPHLGRLRRLDLHQHELRDPVARRDLERLARGRCSAAARAARRGSRRRSGRAC